MKNLFFFYLELNGGKKKRLIQSPLFSLLSSPILTPLLFLFFLVYQETDSMLIIDGDRSETPQGFIVIDIGVKGTLQLWVVVSNHIIPQLYSFSTWNLYNSTKVRDLNDLV